MNRARLTLLILGVGVIAVAGCWNSGITKRGWVQDWRDSAKAASGTGEFLGMSPEAREIEKSMGAHRTKPIVSSSETP